MVVTGVANGGEAANRRGDPADQRRPGCLAGRGAGAAGARAVRGERLIRPVEVVCRLGNPWMGWVLQVDHGNDSLQNLTQQLVERSAARFDGLGGPLRPGRKTYPECRVRKAGSDRTAATASVPPAPALGSEARPSAAGRSASRLAMRSRPSSSAGSAMRQPGRPDWRVRSRSPPPRSRNSSAAMRNRPGCRASSLPVFLGKRRIKSLLRAARAAMQSVAAFSDC